MKLTLTVLAAAVNLSIIAGQNTRPTRGGTAACTGYKSRVDQACTSGYQGDCSARCAGSFLPYFRECADSDRELQSRYAFNQKCTEAVNVDRPTDSRGDRGCGTDITLPVMLSCADWTAEALADGQITEQDDFCRSECHGGLERMVACRGQMSEVIEQSLDVLTPMVGRCAQMLRPPQRGDGGGAGAPECHMDAVREACGAPGVQDDLCTDACLGIMKRTWDACTDGQGTGDDQFADYSDKIDACDDKSQDDGCDKSAAEILQWVATSCCDEDDGDCDGLPKDCNPECAGTFMPFFSRCGKTVFGADKDQLASMEHFNRQCAKASGRQHVIVEPLQPGGGADTGDVGDGGHAQLSGPDPSDPCSKIVSCDDCGGKEGHVGQKCGWCRAEIASKQLLHRTHGGWCSSECVSTSGECSAFQGHTRGQGRGGTDGSAGGRGGGH